MPKKCVRFKEFFMLMSIALFINNAEQVCYQMKILSLRTKDTSSYRFEMTLHPNNSMSSITRVIEDIPVPTWNLEILQYDGATPKNVINVPLIPSNKNKSSRISKVHKPAVKTLYNATVKTCEFFRYIKRIRLLSNVAHVLLSKSGGNLSLECPMAKGTYVLKNIHVPADTGFLRYMYMPNTVYALHGTVYSMRKDKSLEFKCKYEVNGTILKSC